MRGQRQMESRSSWLWTEPESLPESSEEILSTATKPRGLDDILEVSTDEEMGNDNNKNNNECSSSSSEHSAFDRLASESALLSSASPTTASTSPPCRPLSKSHDSGFSDSGASEEQSPRSSSRQPRHVSKVYFYSVSDLLHNRPFYDDLHLEHKPIELAPNFGTAVPNFGAGVPNFGANSLGRTRTATMTNGSLGESKYNCCNKERRSNPKDPRDLSSSSLNLSSLAGDPVAFWIRELSQVHESECTIMLQSKPVTRNSRLNGANSNLLPGSRLSSCRETIRAIQSRAHDVSAVFARLCRHLSQARGQMDSNSSNSGSSSFQLKLLSSVRQLSDEIDAFVQDYFDRSETKVSQKQALPGLKHQMRVHRQVRFDYSKNEIDLSEDIVNRSEMLLETCDRLNVSVASHINNGDHEESDLDLAVDEVTRLGNEFTALIEIMLSQEIKISVEALQGPSLVSSLHCLTHLALEGNHLCRLIARHSGVRRLLEIIRKRPKGSRDRTLAFRALGTICCVLEAILELEECNGLELMSETLCDEEQDNATRSEAAGLLAQITSPWIENNAAVESLQPHLQSLVHALTRLAGLTQSPETFLLSSAALANLTFLESSLCLPLLQKFRTAETLIGVVRTKRCLSVYIQDQVAAILANMAARGECRRDVVLAGGVAVLVDFVEAAVAHEDSDESSKGDNDNEEEVRPEEVARRAALERVQQKSAIALSRLCSDKETCVQLIELGGLRRLIDLCRHEHLRLNSDGVLVACLSAARKVYAHCGLEPFSRLGAEHVVEPRLLDAFLAFSTNRGESFV